VTVYRVICWSVNDKWKTDLRSTSRPWSTPKFNHFSRITLAHAYHVWSTSVNTFASYPAQRQNDNERSRNSTSFGGVTRIVFMVPLSWQKSLWEFMCSFDACRTAPSSCRPSDQTNWLWAVSPPVDCCCLHTHHCCLLLLMLILILLFAKGRRLSWFRLYSTALLIQWLWQYIVLCTIIMVHKGTSSFYRFVDCTGLWSCLV